jgi:hypothetical protein
MTRRYMISVAIKPRFGQPILPLKYYAIITDKIGSGYTVNNYDANIEKSSSKSMTPVS